MDFCTKNIPGIKFFHVSPEDVTESASELKDRFDRAQTVKWTRQFHRFVPVSKSMLHVYKLSSQVSPPELVPISKSSDGEQAPEPPQQWETFGRFFFTVLASSTHAQTHMPNTEHVHAHSAL